MKMPDITLAQVVTLVGAVIALAVAFGVDITNDQKVAVVGLVTILGSVFLHSDAKIRNGRAEVAKAAILSDAATSAELDQVKK
jgi:hypothetical protein